jgi:carotene biosynthesis associated membrane protein
MRLARVLLVAHLSALIFGLAGLLIALPHPELWAGDKQAARVFDFGMKYAGSLHIVLGAAAMAAFGVVAIGWRRTAIFCGCAVPISLSSELIGTGTGWPFGNYAYTNFLGYKVAGHVPFSIPLSWFYLGFSALLLGSAIAEGRDLRPRGVWSVGLGVWFLTVWDLVLDPAMAHRSLAVRFWNWSETGPYFGMPIQNFIGWSATGLLFMALARWLWRGDIEPARNRTSGWFPFIVYAANTFFAMALSASVDLWVPIALAALLGLVPAMLALRPRSHRAGGAVAGESTSAPSWRALPSR